MKKKGRPAANEPRYRWMVAGRAVAAALGGYALTSLAAAVLPRLLQGIFGASLAETVLVATLLSFALYAGVVIWVFSVRSAVWAWVGLAVACAVLLGVAWP